MKRLVLVLVLGLLVVATEAEEGTAGKEQEKLDGKWNLTSKQANFNGDGVPIEFGLFVIAANTGKMEVKGDKLITNIGKETTELTIVFDRTKTPKTVDAKLGKDKVVFRGIYELSKDTLHLCISGKGDRPKEFKNSPDTPLFEYKRE
jgi:uncharacterized protein (TIGR03067 family)